MSTLVAKHRAAPLWLNLLLLVCLVGCSIVLNQWFAPSRIWESTYHATGGLVHPTLLGGMFCIAVEVAIVLFLIGRFRPRRHVSLPPYSWRSYGVELQGQTVRFGNRSPGMVRGAASLTRRLILVRGDTTPQR